MVERLCAMADLPKPRIALIDSEVPNAFATGRNPKHSAVAIDEVPAPGGASRGVLAHELAHIGNRDVLIMTMAGFAMVAGMLTRFAMYGGLFGGGRDRDNGPPVWLIVMLVSVVTYFLSYILIRAISRYREVHRRPRRRTHHRGARAPDERAAEDHRNHGPDSAARRCAESRR